MNELHETALALAEAGWHVFPTISNAQGLPLAKGQKKKPACHGGEHAATRDPEQINKWWTENPDYNIAVRPDLAGMGVIDIDEGSDPNWHNGHELPPTYTVQTPNGGRHLYYLGSIPTTVGDLAPRVDTRGLTGYTLFAPSIVDDKPYVELDDRAPVGFPTWVKEHFAKRSEPAAAPENFKPDLPGNIARAVKHLQALAPAKQGSGCDRLAYEACTKLRELGLSDGKALTIMLDHFKCEPQDERYRGFIERKIVNAFQYGQNEPGASAAADPKEIFGDAVAKIVAEDAAKPVKRSRFYFEDDEEMDLTPEPEWIIPDVIPESSIVLMTARKGSFKTFLALDIALAIATGRETFGVRPRVSGPTFYGGHEGLHLIKKKHRTAWRLAKGQHKRTAFYAAPGPILARGDQQEFIDQIKHRCGMRVPRLIVLDTYSACMVGMDENSPGDANTFILFCRTLIEEFPGCSVLVPAHFGKDESRGTRGSNALEAGVDTVLDVRRHGESTTVEVKVRHHRGAEERQEPWTFEGKKVAGSLVFQPTTPIEHEKATTRENKFERKKIGAALKSLSAYGPDKGATTNALAGQLFPVQVNQAPEVHEAEIKRAEALLRRLSKEGLSSYCSNQGKQLVWHLPELQ